MYAAHAKKKRKEASQLELPICLTLLEKATSDNDRFSAMLEITKQIRSNTFTEDDRQVVLQAMGLQFLSRLIKTTSLPTGCPNNLYKSIALSLLSTLCKEESVIVQPEMKSFLFVINDVLLQSREQSASRNAEMEQMAVDGLDILSHMAQYTQGVQQLVASGLFNTLLGTMTSPHCCNTLRIFSLIGAIVQHSSRLFISQAEKLWSIMEIAALKMSRGSDMKEKMKYARATTLLLNHTPEVDYDIDSDWVRQMMSIVLKLILVKMVPEHSEVVFYLLSAMVTRVSIHVLVADGRDLVTTVKALIARISVEIYMLLDGIGPDNATARYPQLDQVYKLLSEMVHFICGDFGETADADTIISLYRKLVDISNTIMEFLTSIANQEVAVPRNHGVVLVSVRVLAAMLTEVTEDPTPALLKLIPFFNLLCQNIEYADDVKLEVKNVTQAALENIKMMGMQPIKEDSLDDASSCVTDISELEGLPREQTAGSFSASISPSQSIDSCDSHVKHLNDLHLSPDPPTTSHTFTESRSEDTCFSESQQNRVVHAQSKNPKAKNMEEKGNIHTTMFYLSEGTKGGKQNPSSITGSIGEYSEANEHHQENDFGDTFPDELSDIHLSQEKINEYFELQDIFKEEERAKRLSESHRIRATSAHRRKKRNDSLNKSEEVLISSDVWKLTPDDILGFLLPAYMFLLEHDETIRIMVKCDVFQAVVNFIQRSTSETLECKCSANPEYTTINALKVIHHFYECHSDVASTQLCLLDLLELSILSLPNLVSMPNPPPQTCLKMIEVSLYTLISNSGIRKRRSALHRIKHSRFRFFNAVVEYLASFYEFKQNRKRHLSLYVKDRFKNVWETVAGFWCGCVESLCSLVKTEDDLQETVVKTSFLQCFMTFLVHCSDPCVENFPETNGEIVQPVLHLIECAAEASNALRGFVIQNKGMLIARKYNLEKMELRLNQHMGRENT